MFEDPTSAHPTQEFSVLRARRRNGKNKLARRNRRLTSLHIRRAVLRLRQVLPPKRPFWFDDTQKHLANAPS